MLESLLSGGLFTNEEMSASGEITKPQIQRRYIIMKLR